MTIAGCRPGSDVLPLAFLGTTGLLVELPGGLLGTAVVVF